MQSEKGWIIDDEFKELIDIFAMENHHVLVQMLSYAIEAIQYEFDGEEGDIHISVEHDHDGGSRTLTINVRPAVYDENPKTDPVTHQWLPGTFHWRLEKIQRNVDRKYPHDTYSRRRHDVDFLITTDYVPSTSQHTVVKDA